MAPRILVTGAPRSGSEWVHAVLSAADGTVAVGRPDDHSRWPAAVVGKVGIGALPLVEDPGRHGDYWRLWQMASSGADNEARPGATLRRAAMGIVGRRRAEQLVDGERGRLDEVALGILAAAPLPRLGRHDGPVVVESVQCGFSLEVVSTFFDVVIVVRRDARNVVADWLEADAPVPRYEADARVRSRYVKPSGLIGPSPGQRCADLAWAHGLVEHRMATTARHHTEWLTVQHEALCRDPVPWFRQIFDHAGLHWSPEVARVLLGSADAAGDTQARRAAAPDRWRSALTDQQVAQVTGALDAFAVDAAADVVGAW